MHGLSIHDIKDIAITVSALAGMLRIELLVRKAGRVGKAIAHTPDLLHEHTEPKGATLTEAGIEYPFRAG